MLHVLLLLIYRGVIAEECPNPPPPGLCRRRLGWKGEKVGIGTPGTKKRVVVQGVRVRLN